MSTLTLSDAIEAYLKIRRVKFKPTTTRCDANDLRRLLAHVGNVRLDKLTKDHLIDYFYGTHGRINSKARYSDGPIAASTFNVERGRVKTFLDWCVEEGYIPVSPMRGVDRRRVGVKDRLRLTPEQMVELIEGAEYPRDRIVLALGCNTGLRSHAIANLRVGDVDLGAGVLRAYTSKTETTRGLPITLDLDVELRRWLAYYQDQCGPLQADWFLCPARYRFGWFVDPATGERDDDTSVIRPTVSVGRPVRIVHAGLARLGLDAKGEGFHTLRRSSGRAVFEAALEDGDPRAIHVAQAFLQHENAAMTQHYIGTSHERQRLDETMRGQAFLTRRNAGSGAVVSLDAARRKRRGAKDGA